MPSPPPSTSGRTTSPGVHSPADRHFVGMATAALDDYLARNPIHATAIGDHRFDHRMPDLSADGVTEQVRVLSRHLLALDSLDEREMSGVSLVDLGILRDRLGAQVFALRTLAEHTWNPLVWNPGEALHPLIARPAADPANRRNAVLERMRGVPDHLEAARATLDDMPLPHLDVAIGQTRGLADLVRDAIATVDPGAADAALRSAADELLDAAREHARWLRLRARTAARDPRLGAELYGEALAHHLGRPAGQPVDLEDLLERARIRLAELHEEISSVAARFIGGSMATRGVVAEALLRVEDGNPIDPDDISGTAQRSLAAATEFTRQHRLLTVPDLDVRVIAMPAFRRGVAVAYCDAPGTAETEPGPTFIAVAPPPADWSAARQESFLREYNAVMMDNLIVHEGVPGHALQLARAGGAATSTGVRSVFPSGTFIEGWAVYTEGLMVDAGYPGADPGREPLALRLQQLKMAIRSVANTILDIGFHTREMTEPEGRRLLAVDGLQGEGEVTAKWQRVNVTHGQLVTYFVGGHEVTELVAGIRASHPRWSPARVHDTVLGHGSVDPPRLAALIAPS